MKGVVFTEFLEMTEQKFGLEIVDRIIGNTDLSTDGAYTAVGTYDYMELVGLVQSLSKESSIAVPDLVKALGKHLFGSFASSYPFALKGATNSGELLARVEGIIHVEVRKLYPNAELPTIGFERVDEYNWKLLYQSKRPFADLCEGLIEECIAHFDEKGDLTREDFAPTDAGYSAQFCFKAKGECDAK